MGNDIALKMLKLSAQGFQCAQILIILALEHDDKENPDLVRAAGALNVGLSDGSGPCGALTGGCCFISYFAGKGEMDELEDPALKDMISEFSAWFREIHGSQICTEILDGDMTNMTARCPEIVKASFSKAMEILLENNVI